MKKLMIALTMCSIPALRGTPTLLSKELLGFLNPQEYSRGYNTTLIQVPVLIHHKESPLQGSTENSSAYHALRNSIIITQALLEPTENGQAKILCRLYDNNDLHKSLSYEGFWRTQIRDTRDGNYTDNLSLQEVHDLMHGEDQGLRGNNISENFIDPAHREDLHRGSLTGKHVCFSYFECASPVEPNKEDFKALCADSGIDTIKDKLEAGEDFTGMVLVYVSEHDQKDPLFEKIVTECTICTNVNAEKLTPCCKQMSICESCWLRATDETQACPLCREKNPGTLDEVVAKLSDKFPLPGHYIGLVIAQNNGKRQYILTDSQGQTGRFFTCRAVKKLLSYLEDNLEVQTVQPNLLPAFIPSEPNQLTQPHLIQLKTTFEQYIHSTYNIQPASTKAPASFDAKSFVVGILGVIAAYCCYQYYQKKSSSQKHPSQESMPSQG